RSLHDKSQRGKPVDNLSIVCRCPMIESLAALANRRTEESTNRNRFVADELSTGSPLSKQRQDSSDFRPQLAQGRRGCGVVVRAFGDFPHGVPDGAGIAAAQGDTDPGP